DLTRLPFRETSFEKVVCCEVLEHLPGAGQRLASLDQIKRVLMPGGLFVCSVYNFSALQPRFTFRTDRVKEGSHDGAIYFFRFTPDELRHMCGNGLEITRMIGLRSLTMFNLDMVLGRLHLTPLALCVERLLQESSLSCSTGYLLQATMIRNCSREEQ
ncbi:MAG TPA: methyltransferase domain-containing protein, partial [Saprospiraceae bacterium]|nr:methyltransferase domain-containing protein [Saprospiraceae bacterium]